MIRSVVKHSYIKGQKGPAKARAHINYIAHRRGEEIEEGGRKFFDNERDDIGAREVKEWMNDRADGYGVTMHKLILSPGMQEVDVKEYTREVMGLLAQEKRLDLQWGAVIHDNTDHVHAHVVIMGFDKDWHRVKIDKDDHRWLRQCGDEYLNREHKLERYLDREAEHLLKDHDYNRTGDEAFRRLLYGPSDQQDRGEKKERDKEDDPDRARREFELFDKDAKRFLEEREGPDIYTVRHEQRHLEEAGRLSEFHGTYTEAMAKQRGEQLLEERPELAESIKRDLDFIEELGREDALEYKRDPFIERLLGSDREIVPERSIEQESTDRSFGSGEETAPERSIEPEPTASFESGNQSQQPPDPAVDRSFGNGEEAGEQRSIEQESIASFEADSQSQQQQEPQEEKDHDRDDLEPGGSLH